MSDYNTIREELQKVHQNADLPSCFDYKYNKNNYILTITVKKQGLRENMQKDASAFDSWAIALKYYLKNIVHGIIIDWEDDINEGEKGYYHYNRFLYRLTKFVQNYDWVRLAKDIPSLPSSMLCNAPEREAEDITKHTEDTEGHLECSYVDSNKKDYDCMNHQLPVGIFYSRVSRNTHFTPGKKSAIDIWAIKDDELSIFELKIPGNKPLGIISELMFYTNVMDDIFFNKKICYDEPSASKAKEHNYRGFKAFYDAYKTHKIKKIKAVFLADSLHSLLTTELIDFINQSPSFLQKKIKFEWKMVS